VGSNVQSNEKTSAPGLLVDHVAHVQYSYCCGSQIESWW